MKYLFALIMAISSVIILYILVRPIVTIGYIIWYYKFPNFSAYFLYTEKSALRNIEKYLVYKNIFQYVLGEEPIQTVYAEESKPFRYFPEMIVEFS